MATPLINRLRVSGGTFYTFTSATNDLSASFGDSDVKFTFSRFALLNLPDVATPSSNYENYVVWEALGAVQAGGTSSVPAVAADNNLNFAQSFQNYVLNHEQLVLEGKNTLGQAYDTGERATPSERIFFKWLTNLNVLRFRNATSAESEVASRYVETDQTQYYRRVVQYVGDIDIVNSVRKDGQAYTECYLHVPTSHGNTPVVLFKTLADNNYAPGRAWTNGSEYLEGRDSGSVHPTGLDLRAYYDDDSNDRYVTGSTFGNAVTVAGTAVLGSPKPIAISRMDGAVIDFEPLSYVGIADDPSIDSISQYNQTAAASNFQFNVALVYYDLYRESDQADRATNLFGVLVLDDYVNQGSYAYLKRFDKFKPNPISKLNGNSYGLKFDIKFDTSIDNAGVEVVVNEYNTFSMDLYADTMNRVQELTDLFRDNLVVTAELKEAIDKLEQVYYSADSLSDLQARVSELEASLTNAKASLNSGTTYLDLANKLADRLDDIVRGRVPLDVSYNLDLLKTGRGLLADRSVPDQVRLHNTVQEYTVITCGNTSGNLSTAFGNGKTESDPATGNILHMGPFTNYFKQVSQNPDPVTGVETFADDLYINLNESAAGWSNGQVVKIVFDGKIDTGGNSIVIWTDAKNRFNAGAYEKIVGTVYAGDLSSNRPIIEVVCLDATTYSFDVNVLR